MNGMYDYHDKVGINTIFMKGCILSQNSVYYGEIWQEMIRFYDLVLKGAGQG